MCQKVQAAKRAAEPFGILLIARVEVLIADLGVADAVHRAMPTPRRGPTRS